MNEASQPLFLQMARACLNWRSGDYMNFPRAGGWHEQDDHELHMINTCWYAWHVFKMPLSDLGKDKNAKRFYKWVITDG